MNYCTFIVKILKKPEKSYFENDVCVSELPVKFYQFQNSSFDHSLTLCFWGNLANDLVAYYQLNDYVIVEGYIYFRKINDETNFNSKDKQIEICVFKIYPYLLNIHQFNK
jgi:single-stranded DNA-binding protein